MIGKQISGFIRRATLAVVMISILAASVDAQENTSNELSSAKLEAPAADAVQQLRQQVQELQAAVAGMRSDWQRAHEETIELRRELQDMRAETVPPQKHLRTAADASANVEPATENAPYGSNAVASDNQESGQKKNEHSATLDEEYELLSGKVDDQYQTKVESASKYRLRLSGIVLMNLVSNQGVVDRVDLPSLAYARPAGDSGGSFSATLRQSEIGFEIFGPTVAGAKTRADLQLDLAGGFPAVPNGVNSGLLRLRTGTLRMEWANTSLVVGQDALFFSPNSPTSFASLAEPALSYAGNLWAWTPQIRVEHKIVLGDSSSLLLQGGILDPLTGEAALDGTYRQPSAGEASRHPALGSRVAWTRNVFGQPFRLGAGSFYSRQDYGFARTVDAWAGMTDLELPLSHKLSFSGKLYRGRGIGGLYGASGRSALFNGDPALASTKFIGLNSVGGWAQLKYAPANKLEFNAAFGMDNPYATDLRYFPYAQAYGNGLVSRNQSGFVNVIYRPRSDLLFSAEYRHLTTYMLDGSGNSASHLNLMMGVLF